MPLVLTAGPAVEPVSLAEAKAHLRVDGTAEDTLIASLVMTARLHVEAALGLALITQSWSFFLDAWPPRADVALPLRPVQSIAAVRLYAADESVTALDDGAYILDGAGVPPRLVRTAALTWPKPGRVANGVEVAFVAGYGDAADDVPMPIRQAVLLLVAHWHENREPVAIGEPATRVPLTVAELLAPYRWVRL